ncbi:hypothetical protein BLNAU_14922 [Blattamonas nauphoetae]|uniref:Uncharacterized protein n=1 Tax=Blattamonas nauphoetae TaxID=2049346 RepID=A0ABQ9XFD4_9EUKA|nr:hypothetical protein BLNAU_14922 [Blattamonas nauphoetae]
MIQYSTAIKSTPPLSIVHVSLSKTRNILDDQHPKIGLGPTRTALTISPLSFDKARQRSHLLSADDLPGSCNVFSLAALNLSANSLSSFDTRLFRGYIPGTPVQFAHLSEINLSHNFLTTIDLSHAPNVEILNLSHNKLTTFPIFQNHQRLRNLNLSYNDIDSSLLPLLTLRGSLSHLDISHNPLFSDPGCIPEFFESLRHFTALSSLCVQSTPLFTAFGTEKFAHQIQSRLQPPTFTTFNQNPFAFPLHPVPAPDVILPSSVQGRLCPHSVQTYIQSLVRSEQPKVTTLTPPLVAKLLQGLNTASSSFQSNASSFAKLLALVSQFITKKDETVIQGFTMSQTRESLAQLLVDTLLHPHVLVPEEDVEPSDGLPPFLLSVIPITILSLFLFADKDFSSILARFLRNSPILDIPFVNIHSASSRTDQQAIFAMSDQSVVDLMQPLSFLATQSRSPLPSTTLFQYGVADTATVSENHLLSSIIRLEQDISPDSPPVFIQDENFFIRLTGLIVKARNADDAKSMKNLRNYLMLLHTIHPFLNPTLPTTDLTPRYFLLIILVRLLYLRWNLFTDEAQSPRPNVPYLISTFSIPFPYLVPIHPSIVTLLFLNLHSLYTHFTTDAQNEGLYELRSLLSFPKEDQAKMYNDLLSDSQIGASTLGNPSASPLVTIERFRKQSLSILTENRPIMLALNNAASNPVLAVHWRAWRSAPDTQPPLTVFTSVLVNLLQLLEAEIVIVECESKLDRERKKTQGTSTRPSLSVPHFSDPSIIAELISQAMVAFSPFITNRNDVNMVWSAFTSTLLEQILRRMLKIDQLLFSYHPILNQVETNPLFSINISFLGMFTQLLSLCATSLQSSRIHTPELPRGIPTDPVTTTFIRQFLSSPTFVCFVQCVLALSWNDLNHNPPITRKKAPTQVLLAAGLQFLTVLAVESNYQLECAALLINILTTPPAPNTLSQTLLDSSFTQPNPNDMPRTILPHLCKELEKVILCSVGFSEERQTPSKATVPAVPDEVQSHSLLLTSFVTACHALLRVRVADPMILIQTASRSLFSVMCAILQSSIGQPGLSLHQHSFELIHLKMAESVLELMKTLWRVGQKEEVITSCICDLIDVLNHGLRRICRTSRLQEKFRSPEELRVRHTILTSIATFLATIIEGTDLLTVLSSLHVEKRRIDDLIRMSLTMIEKETERKQNLNPKKGRNELSIKSSQKLNLIQLYNGEGHSDQVFPIVNVEPPDVCMTLQLVRLLLCLAVTGDDPIFTSFVRCEMYVNQTALNLHCNTPLRKIQSLPPGMSLETAVEPLVFQLSHFIANIDHWIMMKGIKEKGGWEISTRFGLFWRHLLNWPKKVDSIKIPSWMMSEDELEAFMDDGKDNQTPPPRKGTKKKASSKKEKKEDADGEEMRRSQTLTPTGRKSASIPDQSKQTTPTQSDSLASLTAEASSLISSIPSVSHHSHSKTQTKQETSLVSQQTVTPNAESATIPGQTKNPVEEIDVETMIKDENENEKPTMPITQQAPPLVQPVPIVEIRAASTPPLPTISLPQSSDTSMIQTDHNQTTSSSAKPAEPVDGSVEKPAVVKKQRIPNKLHFTRKAVGTISSPPPTTGLSLAEQKFLKTLWELEAMIRQDEAVLKRLKKENPKRPLTPTKIKETAKVLTRMKTQRTRMRNKGLSDANLSAAIRAQEKKEEIRQQRELQNEFRLNFGELDEDGRIAPFDSEMRAQPRLSPRELRGLVADVRTMQNEPSEKGKVWPNMEWVDEVVIKKKKRKMKKVKTSQKDDDEMEAAKADDGTKDEKDGEKNKTTKATKTTPLLSLAESMVVDGNALDTPRSERTVKGSGEEKEKKEESDNWWRPGSKIGGKEFEYLFNNALFLDRSSRRSGKEKTGEKEGSKERKKRKEKEREQKMMDEQSMSGESEGVSEVKKTKRGKHIEAKNQSSDDDSNEGKDEKDETRKQTNVLSERTQKARLASLESRRRRKEKKNAERTQTRDSSGSDESDEYVAEVQHFGVLLSYPAISHSFKRLSRLFQFWGLQKGVVSVMGGEKESMVALSSLQDAEDFVESFRNCTVGSARVSATILSADEMYKVRKRLERERVKREEQAGHQNQSIRHKMAMMTRDTPELSFSSTESLVDQPRPDESVISVASNVMTSILTQLGYTQNSTFTDNTSLVSPPTDFALQFSKVMSCFGGGDKERGEWDGQQNHLVLDPSMGRVLTSVLVSLVPAVVKTVCEMGAVIPQTQQTQPAISSGEDDLSKSQQLKMDVNEREEEKKEEREMTRDEERMTFTSESDKKEPKEAVHRSNVTTSERRGDLLTEANQWADHSDRTYNALPHTHNRHHSPSRSSSRHSRDRHRSSHHSEASHTRHSSSEHYSSRTQESSKYSQQTQYPSQSIPYGSQSYYGYTHNSRVFQPVATKDWDGRDYEESERRGSERGSERMGHGSSGQSYYGYEDDGMRRSDQRGDQMMLASRDRWNNHLTMESLLEWLSDSSVHPRNTVNSFQWFHIPTLLTTHIQSHQQNEQQNERKNSILSQFLQRINTILDKCFDSHTPIPNKRLLLSSLSQLSQYPSLDPRIKKNLGHCFVSLDSVDEGPFMLVPKEQLVQRDQLVTKQAEMEKELAELRSNEKSLLSTLSSLESENGRLREENHQRLVDIQLKTEEMRTQLEKCSRLIGASECIVTFSSDHFRVRGSTVTLFNSADRIGCFTKHVLTGIHRLSIKTLANVMIGVIHTEDYLQRQTTYVHTSAVAAVMRNKDGMLFTNNKSPATNNVPRPEQEWSAEADLEKRTLHFFIDGIQQPHHFINIPVPLVFALDVLTKNVPIEITFWGELKQSSVTFEGTGHNLG